MKYKGRSKRLTFRSFAVVVLFCSLIPVGCGIIIIKPFPGGVRVTAEETVLELGNTYVPVSSAFTNGQVTQILGAGVGNQSFQGYTNDAGIADFPSSYGNAEWLISIAFFSSSAPECPADSVTRAGSPDGLIENFVCVAF